MNMPDLPLEEFGFYTYNPQPMTKVKEPIVDVIIDRLLPILPPDRRTECKDYYRRCRRTYKMTEKSSRRATAVYVVTIASWVLK